MLSSPFFAEIFSRWVSSSALYFSASLTIFSMSSLESLPLSLVMVILFSFPVDLSVAETLRMPLASMSKYTAGRGRDSGQLELAELVVVLCHGALTLVHLNEYTGLVVAVGGEGLGLLRGNGRVPFDQGGHHSTCGLNAEGERRHVEQKEVLHLLAGVAGQNG